MPSTSILGASFRNRSTEDSLRNQAYQRIKEKIISGAMPPASLIDENMLMAELKVGYTPIRQALRWLALENLVVILPRRGTMVADVNTGDLQKIYELRVHLVPYAFRLAAKRATPRQILDLETYLADSHEVIAHGDVAQLLEVDRKGQRLVIEASQNEFLIEVLERLHNQAMRFWRLDHVSEPDLRRQVGQHRKIVAALKGGKAQVAGRLIRDVIANFHRRQTALS